MQYFKYPAALLIESRGGEGGEAMPDVSMILSPPLTCTLALLMYPCIRTTSQSLPFLPVGPVTILFFVPNPTPLFHLYSSFYSSLSFSSFSLLFLFFYLLIPIPRLFFLVISIPYFPSSFSSYSYSFLFFLLFSFLFLMSILLILLRMSWQVWP